MTEHSEQINELAKALAAAQGEMSGAIKDSKNPHFKSSYADLASCMDSVREQLSKHGLSYSQTPEPNEAGRVVLCTTLMHSSGQWIRGRVSIRPVKDDPQGYGSALTYARRYGLCAIVGIAQVDDDGEAAQGRGKVEAKAERRGDRPKPQARPEPDKAELDRRAKALEFDARMKAAVAAPAEPSSDAFGSAFAEYRAKFSKLSPQTKLTRDVPFVTGELVGQTFGECIEWQDRCQADYKTVWKELNESDRACVSWGIHLHRERVGAK